MVRVNILAGCSNTIYPPQQGQVGRNGGAPSTTRTSPLHADERHLAAPDKVHVHGHRCNKITPKCSACEVGTHTFGTAQVKH